MIGRHTHSPSARGSIAPMHRGPQAVSHTGIGNVVHAPNAALLIDFDNVTMGIRSDLGHELRNLLGSDIIKGKVAVQRAYADWRRYPQYIVPLAESSIDMIMAPAYGSSKKNATDIRLAIDAMELVFTRPEIGTFILLSGDSDFSSLVMKIKEYGKYVIGVGIRESSSDLLVQNCDEYYSYNALAGLVKSGETETTRKWDPWQLVTEAINRMVQNHDVMRSDRLKQVMQEIDSSFDEKDLGISKFSRFCQDAAHKGLIKVTKLENGQLEVAPPSGARTSGRPEKGADVRATDAGDSEAASPADGESDEPAPRPEGRSRRGRRGGRGRKRGDRKEVLAENGLDSAESHSMDAVGDVAPEFDGAAPTANEPLETVSAPVASIAVAATVEAPVSSATAQPVDAPVARPSRGRGSRGPRVPRAAAQAATEAGAPIAAPVVASVAAPDAPSATDDAIGQSGLRLTREEAMNLVRGAVAALTTGDESVPDEVVRAKAFALLGRDSESLSVRNFSRILRDAHDNDIVDLRRRGNSFEVARAAAAASVADQLAVREQEAKAAEPQEAATPPVPRGMATRSAPSSRGRGPSARKAPPPELLMIGVVDDVPSGSVGSSGGESAPRA
ncbi:MAG: NYN domain-containing protein [Gemmatimonadota bacterium]|nr:NYN domain-containing protein [Gemmatimonadota bacterium]